MMKKLLFMLLTVFAFAACDKESVGEPSQITVPNQETLTQTVHADNTTGQSGVNFSTQGPWTSSVAESTGARASRAGTPDWVSISPSSGDKAGNYTINIQLGQNLTGVKRTATITIICGGDKITITVTQEATTAEGEVPVPEPESLFLSAAGKITGGEIFGNTIPTALNWMMIRLDTDNDDTYSPTSYPYANKNFDITLPVPAANQLGALNETGNAGLTLAPNDMKFTSAVVDYEGGYLELTNIAWQNISDVNGENTYKIKQSEGFVRFIYASKAGVVNGTLAEASSKQTFVFNNCTFRQGWNEMVMLAAADAAADGTVTINVTANNAPATFKWVAQTVNDEEAPTPIAYVVTSIDEQAVGYSEDGYRVTVGDYTPVSKYIDQGWVYIDFEDYNRCNFTYTNAKLTNTVYGDIRYEGGWEADFQWANGQMHSIVGYHAGVSGDRMTTVFEYSATDISNMPNNNLDVNFLVGLGGVYAVGLPFSAVSPQGTAPEFLKIAPGALISKRTLVDPNGDQYSHVETFRYEFDNNGNVSKVFSTRVSPYSGNWTDELLFSFTYEPIYEL